MKLFELVRTYQTVQSHYSHQFKDAQVFCEHDTVHIHLDKPSVFSDKDLEFLDKLGLHVHTTANSDNDVQSFVIYL